MSKKDKLEQDYKNFNMNIERAAEREIKEIREEINAVREEARKISEAVELSINEKEAKAVKKKVNT
ncbi:MAG: hypothetical protein ABSA75_07655 [Candidatus Bathyarchaeia archaeon]|jgi:Ser-tRNA(Ala) deacylase AlaX